MKKLTEELIRINQTKNIKIGRNILPKGYSLYLEYNKEYKRFRKFLKLKVSNEIRMTKEDEETLYKAEIIRDTMELELYGNSISFMLNNKLGEISFIDYATNYVENANLPAYKACLKQIKEYVRLKFLVSNIKMNEVNVKFCQGFKEFLEKKISKRKLANQTAKTYLSIFAAILNKAFHDKIIQENPAARIRIKLIESKREFLSDDELRQLILVDTKYTEIKNAFLFSTQTSLRLGDIRNIKIKDIRINNNEAFLYFRQQKTKGLSHMKLPKLAQDIFLEQKLKNLKEGLVFILPKSVSFINEKIRLMAEQSGIEKYISFHVARHTFATIALSKGIDIYTVSKIMGHSSVSVTEIYANLVNKKRDEVADIMNFEIAQEDIERKNRMNSKNNMK
jgi:integrase